MRLKSVQWPGLTLATRAPSYTEMNTDYGHLPHLGLLRFHGPDAASFLQGQVSIDTRQLESGSAVLAAYSSPQGRVLSILHLLPHSSGVIAILPSELLQQVRERLQKFVMRSKVQIEDVSQQLCVAGQHAVDAPDMDAPSYGERDGICVARLSQDPQRCWIVGSNAALASRGLVGDVLDQERIERRWRLQDIRAGLPQVYLATSELFVAQMLNLDLINGISFTKGCFTGQEIIARTQHLGRVKRRMHRLRLPAGNWSIGQSLKLTDGRAGRLIEVIATGECFEALAVLNLPDSGTAHELAVEDAVAADELPLPYRLGLGIPASL